jgi:hypothetical protein
MSAMRDYYVVQCTTFGGKYLTSSTMLLPDCENLAAEMKGGLFSAINILFICTE